MSLTNPFHGMFPPQEWDSSQPSPMQNGGLYGEHATPLSNALESNVTPDEICSETPGRPSFSSPNRARVGKLNVLQLVDWDKDRTYDEDPPNCLHYSIEWKVTVNGKVISKDTEQDLVLVPASRW